MHATSLQNDEVIFLFGAGASVDAGIPDSRSMITELEYYTTNGELEEYRDLYRFIYSCAVFADSLYGVPHSDSSINIERIVNILEELQKKEGHILYPLVGAWNPTLVDVAGEKFRKVHGLHTAIIDKLRKKWVTLSDYKSAHYYKSLLSFQQEYGYPLRAFSLNYDLCIEYNCGFEVVQRGFVDRKWDWRLFDEDISDRTKIYLYKLHGSLDWSFEPDGSVSYSDEPSWIDDEKIALIFGTSYKLQYLDPFLFLAYELRRRTLDPAKVIVTIGYGFADEHINGILGQSLKQNENRRLVAVVGPTENEESEHRLNLIEKKLESKPSQVVVRCVTAQEFLDKELSVSFLEKILPTTPELIRNISSIRDLGKVT